jgi:hypothetical protein
VVPAVAILAVLAEELLQLGLKAEYVADLPSFLLVQE